MNLGSGIGIGRVRGIEIRVHWSWFIILVLITWSFADGLYRDLYEDWSDGQRWTAAIVTSALFFLSVLLHELSHSFVAQRYGMTVPSITLFVFGGVSSIAGEMRNAKEEFAVAIAGPLMSWVLAGVFALLWVVLRGSDVSGVVGYLAFINGALGLFNLLPGFPLDGGRVLRAIVWGRSKSIVQATRVAATVGSIIAYAMIGIGLVSVFYFGLFGAIWYVLIGLFLKSAAEGSYQAMLADRALRNVETQTIMQPPTEPVDGSMSVQELVETRLLRRAERAYLVGDEGHVVGLVTATDITRLPRDQWARTPVERVMVPSARVHTVTPQTDLVDAMRLMQQYDVHQLPVLEDGRLVGMLTRGDVLRQVEVRMRFQDGNG
ncbi:MAG: site-2 protease family protein [Dehalococcoidia bacterium]